MAYFPNGMSQEVYEFQWCSRCIHWKEDEFCPVMELHFDWNYDAVGKDADGTKATALSHFIPMKGVEPLQCRMFVAAPQAAQEEKFVNVSPDEARTWWVKS
jgi:hypothetical protein